MKKGPVILIVLIIIVLIASTNTVLLSGCKSETIKIENIQEVIIKGPPEIEEVVLAKGVDENYSPVEPTEVFPAGTESIFLTIKFKNFTTDDNLKVVWSYLDAGTELSIQEYIPEEDGSGNHYFNINSPASFQPGKYSARVTFNGELFEDLEFTVE